MFCNQCGAACEDGAKFCKSCGNSMQAPAQAPVQQPAYQQPAYQQPAQSLDAVGALKKYWAVIVAVVAAFALILAIMNIFNTYDVTATVKYGDEKQTSSGPVADLFVEEADGEYAAALIGNIVFGVANLAIAAVGILYFLKKQMNMPYYDQFVAKLLKTYEPAFLLGLIGAITAVLQVILYAMCTQSETYFGTTFSASFSVHWTTWVGLVLYAAMAAADKFVLNKKQ